MKVGLLGGHCGVAAGMGVQPFVGGAEVAEQAHAPVERNQLVVELEEEQHRAGDAGSVGAEALAQPTERAHQTKHGDAHLRLRRPQTGCRGGSPSRGPSSRPERRLPQEDPAAPSGSLASRETSARRRSAPSPPRGIERPPRRARAAPAAPRRSADDRRGLGRRSPPPRSRDGAPAAAPVPRSRAPACAAYRRGPAAPAVARPRPAQESTARRAPSAVAGAPPRSGARRPCG